MVKNNVYNVGDYIINILSKDICEIVEIRENTNVPNADYVHLIVRITGEWCQHYNGKKMMETMNIIKEDWKMCPAARVLLGNTERGDNV